MTVKITDHVARAIGRLPQQYRTATPVVVITPSTTTLTSVVTVSAISSIQQLPPPIRARAASLTAASSVVSAGTVIHPLVMSSSWSPSPSAVATTPVVTLNVAPSSGTPTTLTMNVSIFRNGPASSFYTPSTTGLGGWTQSGAWTDATTAWTAVFTRASLPSATAITMSWFIQSSTTTYTMTASCTATSGESGTATANSTV